MTEYFKALFRLIRWLTVDQWQRIDREYIEPLETEAPAAPPPRRSKRSKKLARDVSAPPAGRRYDLRPLIVLVVVAVSLSLQEYFGQQDTYDRLFKANRASEYYALYGFAWWSGWRVFGYIVIPILAIWAMPGERVRDYFLGLRGFFTHIWIYVGMFAAFFPVIVVLSGNDSFRATYPFYKLASRSTFDLWAWEAMYAAQFVALEFFFRGFMLKALAPRLGSQAIFVMIVPYCMIHFGKPLPETLAAIAAGVILGTLAMRTRSIWGGVAIHIAVAISMDVLALRG